MFWKFATLKAAVCLFVLLLSLSEVGVFIKTCKQMRTYGVALSIL